MLSDLDSGLLWVENRIRELAKELGRPVDCVEWPKPNDAQYGQIMLSGIIPLKIWRGGEFRIIEFLKTELRDVEETLEIQRWLEVRIREGLKDVGT
jgi:hypothetical protein